MKTVGFWIIIALLIGNALISILPPTTNAVPFKEKFEITTSIKCNNVFTKWIASDGKYDIVGFDQYIVVSFEDAVYTLPRGDCYIKRVKVEDGK